MVRYDVVVVGGAIAGSALATVLARDGLQVLVLERQTEFRDMVRGETLVCWGVAELLRMKLDEPLLAAGGGYATRFVGYDEIIDPGRSAGLTGTAADHPAATVLWWARQLHLALGIEPARHAPA